MRHQSMYDFPKIVLHANKALAVKRYHPWIFSRAIKEMHPGLKDGEIVEVYDENGEYLATGHYSTGNIAVKIFSFKKFTDIRQLFLEKFQQAYLSRKQIGLVGSESTNCYRLIFTEGDGLPGLIVDWYNGTAVLQASSVGMYQLRDLIVESLQNVYGQELKAVYDKSASVLPRFLKIQNEYLLGTRGDGEVLENGYRFFVDWEEGQKTGFFLDQRDNRQRLAKYATGKRVLNTFSYSGGFSVYALKAQAELVHSVDCSAKAIEWAKSNLQLNNSEAVPQDLFVGDVFDFLKECNPDYDVIILDPPAFAKTQAARHKAVMAYKRLNKQAIAKIKPGGILFTFSCSQVVEQEHFQGAVVAAAIECGRQIKVLEHLNQAADHPVSIFHPEGKYLKGFVLMVE